MAKVPNPTSIKELPLEDIKDKEVPKTIKLNKEQPEKTSEIEAVPNETAKLEVVPVASPEKEEKPSDFLEDNCVVVGDKKIEIKPTKLKYFRNKAASAYGIIKAVPLHELLTCGKGVFDPDRDADQLLYDFLIAAFDDSVFVRDNYDNIDADVVDRVVKIFGRVNHIDEKEEAARKNKEAQAKP